MLERLDNFFNSPGMLFQASFMRVPAGPVLRAVGRVVLRRPFGIGALGRYRGIGREQASPEPSGELMLLASWCCWREYLIRARNEGA